MIDIDEENYADSDWHDDIAEESRGTFRGASYYESEKDADILIESALKNGWHIQAHTNGDRHRDIFIGPERAARLNPLKGALDRGVRFTLHHDAPVTTTNMMVVIQSAVHRVTSSDKPLGREFEIPVMEALKAVTINAAWQEGEEAIKGSIEVGKLADLVILSSNPLKVKSTAIKDIKVMETIKEGKSIYVAP